MQFYTFCGRLHGLDVFRMQEEIREFLALLNEYMMLCHYLFVDELVKTHLDTED